MKGSVTPKVSSLLVVAGQRAGGDFQQQVVLPEAERQGDAEDDEADDDAGAQLVEVLDEGEPVLVGDRPDPGHRASLSGGRGRPARSRLPSRLRRRWLDRLGLIRLVGSRR